jgi:hypothetical protein
MKQAIVLLLIFCCVTHLCSGQAISRITADSTKIYNLSNTGNELIIENDTRTVTGGFLKNRVNGRTEFACAIDTFWVGHDTLYYKMCGSTAYSVVSLINTKTGSTVYDSTMVIADSDTPDDSVFKAKTWLDFKPLSRSPAIDLNNQNFRFVQSTHRFGTGLLSDEVMQWGWNIGTTLDWQAWSKPSIYFQMEQNYVPGAGSSLTELHTIWRQPSNNNKWRLQSWTLNNGTGNIDLYFTDGRFYHKRTGNTVYFQVDGSTLPSLEMTATSGEKYAVSMSSTGFTHGYTSGAAVASSVSFTGLTQEKHSASDIQFGEKTASTGATITIKDATTALSSYASTATSTNISTLTNVAINLKPNNTTALTATATSITLPSLASGGTAPTTSGTTKMVVTDANGLLSFASIPSADSFTFTTWARSQSRFDSLGAKVVHNTGTETIAGAKTFSSSVAMGAGAVVTGTLTASGDLRASNGVSANNYFRFMAIDGSGISGYFSYNSNGNLYVADNTGSNFTSFSLGGNSTSPSFRVISNTSVDLKTLNNASYVGWQSLYERYGSGSPEGVVTAPVGCTYKRTDGGTGTAFYVKESGSGNTGWVAK